MKVFKFRLEAFLRLKEESEKQKAIIYAKALRIHQDANEKVLRSQKSYEDAEENWINRQNQGAMGALDIQREYVFREALQSDLHAACDFHRLTESEAVKNREILVKARQEREVLQALKKKQKEAYNYEAIRREEKNTEDLIQARWNNHLSV